MPSRTVNFCVLCAFLCSFAFRKAEAQTSDKFLVELLQQNADLFGPILKDPAKYDVQILYTQIDRDAQNRPSFRPYRYRIDKNRYFYPASTVKFPAVLLALETLRSNGISPESVMLTDSARPEQSPVRSDTSAQNGKPSVAQYARKILLVSDNDAYNRLYELLGQCQFNERLRAKGYTNTRILHRLSVPLSTDQNRYTNPVRLLNEQGNVSLAVSAQECKTPIVAPERIERGIGFMRRDSLIKQPFDFTTKNAFPLEDQQAMLRAVLFPDDVPAKQRFNLAPDDYRFLYQYMSAWPRESRHPRYDSTHYDSYCKFLLLGDQKGRQPGKIRIFNKVGDAYGYLIDNAYVVDFERGVEFMLSAVIYCNQDGVFNDDKYEYETVGFPFMANLGRAIYDYEVSRKRQNQPDLSRFRVDYALP